jgi:prevent-host-death family protein
VTEAKNRLSALLDRVRHGETVLIEDRGVAVAQLSPVARGDRGDPGVDADRLARLERSGILRPPQSPKPSAILLGRPPRAGRPHALSRSVADERASGW